jgi:hypothetical protein
MLDAAVPLSRREAHVRRARSRILTREIVASII